MDDHRLTEIIRKKKSFLCIGLDTDIKKIPAHLHHFKDPCLEFNKQIIDTTHDLCVAFKPNVAFYESRGAKGWETLEHTVAYIRSKYPDMFLIADAKRGDIGNTSGMYARAFFEEMDFDAVTVAPYMGEDSVLPFMAYKDKWVILLALTSNKGAFDFQFHTDHSDEKLFESVIKKSQEWGNTRNLMYVVGATKAEMLRDIRKIAPKHFLLVPGVGAQGGSLEDVVKYGMNEDCGLLVNSSRGIIYADHTTQFAEKARVKAQEIQQQMSVFLASL